MGRVALVVLIACSLVAAKERKVVETIIKADTTVTIKVDTVRTIKYDTLKVTKTYNDTAVLLKADTSKVEKKPAVKK